MIQSKDKSPHTIRLGKTLWVWAAFSTVLVLLALGVLRAKPLSTFGVGGDDALYFSSAKALAADQGYFLPSFPGHLPSMKYPKLYPLLLAGVWKLDPHFPGNLVGAVGLSFGFGCLALLVTFLMLRQWPNLGDWPAIAIVFLVSVGGTFAYQSAFVGTDIPFMAFILGAVYLTERSLERESDSWAALGSGLLAGMSVGLRSLGIPVAMGIGLFLLLRRKFRRLLWFSCLGLPLTLVWSWPTVSGVLGLSPSVAKGDATGSGWGQTVCWYSSYGCEWGMHIPKFSTLLSTIALNLRLVAQAPGELLLHPLATSDTIVSLVLVTLLSVAVYVGIIRHGQRTGWRPLHAIFPLYLLVILAYPFNPGRYLLPFGPLFFAGLWLEGRHIVGVIAGRLKQSCGRDERAASGILAAGAIVLAAIIAINYGYSLPQKIENLGTSHEKILADEQVVYQWLRQHAASDARIIALEDGLTYLYTGRKSVRSIFCISEGYYVTGSEYIQHDASRLGDVARHVNASYWLTTPYDYPLQTPRNRALLIAKQRELLETAPVVYRSPDGQIVLYDTRRLWTAKGSNDPQKRSKFSATRHSTRF